MENIDINISIVENNAAALIIHFEIVNKTEKDILILKRNTPLEGLKSDCLIVTTDGQKVEYDGFLLKRAPPAPQEFIELKAGESVSNEMDVSEAYDVSAPGTYDVKFDESKLVIVPATDKKNLVEWDTKKKSITSAIAINNQQAIIERTIQQGKATIGQRMREESKKKIIDASSLLEAGLRPPKIRGGNEEQSMLVAAAHKNGYQYAKKALQEVKNNQLYKKWFGEHTAAREQIVKTVFSKLSARLERTIFTYQIDGGECDETTYAYTTTGGATIWLCTLFWTSPDTGADSKAGTLVHEHSHASADTDDYKYSRKLCEQLAISHPDTAINNADNFEFYAESFFM